MATTDWDVVIGSTKAKLVRVEEGYSKRVSRAEVQQQILAQRSDLVLSSRADSPSMYQTSWAKGAEWWRPLVADDIRSYFQSNHFDLWSEPGKVVPMPSVLERVDADIHENTVTGVGADNTLFFVDGRRAADNTFRVRSWTGTIISSEGPYTSGMTTAPCGLIYDSDDGYFYGLTFGGEVTRFNPTSGATDKDWITGVGPVSAGATIFITRAGVTVWTGEKLLRVNKDTASTSVVYDDGLGSDLLSDLALDGTPPVLRPSNIRLAVPTPEGVYLVKNIRGQDGQAQARVYRVERDVTGVYTGVPLASLPKGAVALSAQYHLGSLVVACSPETGIVLDNKEHFEVMLLSVDRQNLNVMGSVLGNRDEVDESPAVLLGSVGAYLYVGGHKRLWVYDASRGGLHTAWEWDVPTSGGWAAMSWDTDHVNNEGVVRFMCHGRQAMSRYRGFRPAKVAAFGDDLEYYVLESNYFDALLPMEIKHVSEVAVQHDPGDGSQEWRVDIQADDGDWQPVLKHSAAGEVHGSAVPETPISGYRFRYRLIYQTTSDVRIALRAVLVRFTTGEMVTEYDLLLDGTEMLNIDNEMQDEATFRAEMEAVAGTEATVPFVDNYVDQDRNVDLADAVPMKVASVAVSKSKPGESMIRVVLREP